MCKGCPVINFCDSRCKENSDECRANRIAYDKTRAGKIRKMSTEELVELLFSSCCDKCVNLKEQNKCNPYDEPRCKENIRKWLEEEV